MAILLDRPYCTAAQVFNALGILDVNEQAKLSDLVNDSINQASRTIDDITLRRFYKTSLSNSWVDFQASGPGAWIIHPSVINVQNSYLEAPWRPIIQDGALSISEYLQQTFGSTPTPLVEGTDYVVDYQLGHIMRIGADWNRLPQGIKITCNLGYSSTDNQTPAAGIPGIITRSAVKMAAAFTYRMRRDVFSTWTGAKAVVAIADIDDKTERQLMALRLRRDI